MGNKKRKISDRITTYGLFWSAFRQSRNDKIWSGEAGFEVLIGHIPMTKIARAKEKGETKGFMEAIIDAKTNQF
jgi:hypothetical protein